MKRLLLAFAGMLLAGVAQAACPTTSLTFKDAAGTTQTLCFGGAAGQFIPQHQIIDSGGVNIASVSATGAQKVDGSAVTQPVSGTVTANAGTNLNTSALALDSSVNALSLSQGSATSGQKGSLTLAAVTTAKPTYTTGQTSSISLDTSGLLRLSLADTPSNTNNLNVLLATGGNVIGAVTQSGGPWTSNITQIGGAALAFGQAAMAASVPVTIANNQSALPVSQNGNWITRLAGNTGNPLDFAGQNAVQPASALLTGCAFNTSPTTVGSGNATQIQCDNSGNTLVKLNVALPPGGNTIGAVTQSSGPWTQNLTQVGGAAVALGQTTMAASVPVAIASNQSTLSANIAQVAGGAAANAGQTGALQVGGAVAAAGLLSAATFPNLIGGSDYAGTPHAQTWKVDSTGIGYMNCTNCSGTSQLDSAGFAATITQFGPVGGFFQTTATNNTLSNLTMGAFQVTAQRALFTNLRNSSGTEIGTTSNPIITQDNLAIGSTTSGQTGGLVMGATTTAAPTYTTGQTNPVSLDTAGNLRINCITGCSSSGGSSVVDVSTFTPGPAGTALTLGGGFFQTTATNNALTNLQEGAFQVTANRALFTNLRNAAGAEVGTSGSGLFVSQAGAPWAQNISQLGGNGVATAGVNGTLAVGGNQATNSNVSTNVFPQLIAGSDYGGTPKIQSLKVDANGVAYFAPSPSALAGAAIAPVVSAAAESNHILKASAGNLYSVYVTTGATAGFLMIFNATTAPADGAVTPVECMVAPASSTTGINAAGSPPSSYATGIVAVFSSTGCFTKTASATAFFKGMIQ